MLVLHNAIGKLNAYLPHINHWSLLAASVPVALSTGSLFVYSVYGTQLADKCRLQSSQAANLNISATVGTAIGGCVSGVITDIYGSQIPILTSCLCLSIGYKWLHFLYNRGPDAQLWQLLAAMFLIGIGSVSGYFSSLKAVAIHFPKYKATAQSVTIASFAISSLLYSFISTQVFKGDASKFLYFLFVSCGIMTFTGFIFIRIDGYIDDHDRPIAEPTIDENGAIVEAQPLLDQDEPLQNDEIAASSSLQITEQAKPKPVYDLQHKTLRQSLLHPIFWVHYLILAIIQGLGQMYIYSVGFILKAIHYHYTNLHDKSDYSPTLNELQAWHVSLIAITSFLGRLSSGPQADYLVHKLKLQRHWILVLGLVIMFTGHFMNTFNTDSFSKDLYKTNIYLSVASCFIGYAYGFSFTCYPAIISDLFSMRNYSFIWGVMYTSTTFGLTLMTKIFGIVYDSNSDRTDSDTGAPYCDKGSECYDLTFKLTSAFAVVAGGIILLYIHHRSRHN